MTREEIIVGLKFTVEMFLYNPSTGETFTEPRNDMDKTTIDACKGAIELLEQEPVIDKIRERVELEKLGYPPSADYYKAIMKVLQIIDKYKESEEQI